MNDKIKPMSVDEMILALDRISRFKYPEKKLKRVYTETICAHYITQKIKKSDIENFENKKLRDLFEKIWNFSIKYHYKILSDDFSLNNNFIEQEKKCYFLDKNQLDLMPKHADFKTLIVKTKKNPNNFDKYISPAKIILTEGATEEILLPELSKYSVCDFFKKNIKIIATGGKSQTIKKYKIYKKEIKIPIYILLDNDALHLLDEFRENLREIDKIHLILSGEIEDIIPKILFKKAINSEFKLQSKISIKDFDKNNSTVENLHNIYKKYGFGEFKKAKMANMIKNCMDKNTKLSSELEIIFKEIKNL